MADELEKTKVKRDAVRKNMKKHLEKIKCELASAEIDGEVLSDCVSQVTTRETRLAKLNQIIMDLTTDLSTEVDEIEDWVDYATLWKERAKRWIEKNSAKATNLSAGNSTTSIDSVGRSHQTSSTIKLPQIHIKKFSGGLEQWQRFWPQFNVAVNQQPNLDSSAKLIYLRSYVEGPAEKAIEGIENDFDMAAEILEKRFGRKEMIASARINNLLKMKPVYESSNVEALRYLHDSCQIEVRSLESLGMLTDQNMELYAHILGGLLPLDLLEEFGKYEVEKDEKSDKEEKELGLWSIINVLEFLRKTIERKEQALAIHRSGRAQTKSSQSLTDKPKSIYRAPVRSMASAAALNVTTSSSGQNCVFCSEPHPFYTCDRVPVAEKKNIALRKRLCFLCLKSNHQSIQCRTKFRQCRKCRRQHHQILCDFADRPTNNYLERSTNSTSQEYQSNQTPQTHVKQPTSDTTNGTNNNSSVGNFNAIAQNQELNGSEIYLQTVRAIMVGPQGEEIKVRCLLDGGSHRCFVRSELAEKLKLQIVGDENLNVFPFERETPIVSNRRRFRVFLKNVKTEENVEITALETPSISGTNLAVPTGSVVEELRERGYEMSDSQGQNRGGNASKIDVLIGADHFWKIARGPVERLSETLVAIDTKLGWTLHGGDTTNTIVGAHAVAVMKVSVTPASEEDLLSVQIQSFWDTESIGILDSASAAKGGGENHVMKAFRESVKFKNGQYEVELPWKDNVKYLRDNYEVAKRRALNLVKKLEANPKLFKAYDQVIKEQLESGIIERVPSKFESPPIGVLYYLPHQGVIKEDRETTKLRIVQDASSHAKDAPSLNDCLEQGPNLLPELFEILVRFRERKIGLTGDIAKAFHSIGIAEKDRNALRFLWVEGLDYPQNQKLIEFRMTKVPFGVTTSPFLLNATILHHTDKVKEEYPIASEVLQTDRYVDDLVGNRDTVEEANILIRDSTKILADAGMSLRKIRSNSEVIRNKWTNQNTSETTKSLSNPSNLKVLGMVWDEINDNLAYEVDSLLKFLVNKQNTKRWVLKAVARIFDPLGLLSPFTIRAKFIFQELWKQKLKWDTELSIELQREFCNWCNELPKLVEFKIPRFYYENDLDEKPKIIELHGFVDASESAYAAVFYLKSVFTNDVIKTVLVASKARVAPLGNQKLTIPRLELMGALLGARLTNTLMDTLTIKPQKVKLWTDSKIALGWIRGSACRWKQFIQNRVREIQTRTDPEMWSHCAGVDNPADLPTRGKSLEEIARSDIWLHGPKWLRKPENQEIEFVYDENQPVAEEIQEELKSTSKDVIANLNPVESTRELFNLKKYSGLNQVLNITAWIIRFGFNSRNKAENRRKGPLTTEEIARAEVHWVKTAQEERFPDEILSLKKKEAIQRKSTILTLNPFLNDQGVMCLGGRLGAAKMSYRERHPWILSSDHQLSYLIGWQNHVRLKHAGINDVITQVREQYWIPKARQLINKVIYSCPRCKRFKAKPSTAVMAPLPEARINPAPPFDVCGIDHAGPIYAKPNNKCYFVVFTCAVTRAVHLELVSSLTTESFLMAFRRFIARRGIVRIIYSDNAANFKRADADLRIIFENMRSPKSIQFYGSLKIQWRYIADRAAWWGGFWERMVRSVKTSLRKVLGQAHLAYEELETLLIEIEATINSRPITYVYENPDEPRPLTPAHFLVGKRLTTLPSQTFTTEDAPTVNKREIIKRLKYRQTVLDRFWTRWKTNYLLELRSAHHRTNLKGEPSNELKINDVVLLEDNMKPRSMWKLAVVEQVMRGRDEIVRSCMIRMPNGSRLRRPIQHLYNLEF